jgi:hypothetical protein
MRSMDDAAVVVFQDRTRFGDPRMGAFKVYLDGRKAGIAPVHGELSVAVAPGDHTVSVGQLWFRSPAMTVAVAPGSTTRLRADIPLSLPLARRMVLFLLRPRRCLVLEVIRPTHTRVDAERSQFAGETARRGFVAEGTVSLVGALLILVGLKVGIGLIVVGIVVFVAGAVVGTLALLKAKRIDSSKDKPV